jgi:hypothetical protein
MKTFSQLTRDLHEAKMKLPTGHSEIKVERMRVGGKNYDVTYSQKGREVYAYINDNETGPYRNMKEAEKSVKDMSKLFKQMNFEGVEIEEIFNEINFRV